MEDCGVDASREGGVGGRTLVFQEWKKGRKKREVAKIKIPFSTSFFLRLFFPSLFSAFGFVLLFLFHLTFSSSEQRERPERAKLKRVREEGLSLCRNNGDIVRQPKKSIAPQGIKLFEDVAQCAILRSLAKQPDDRALFINNR